MNTQTALIAAGFIFVIVPVFMFLPLFLMIRNDDRKAAKARRERISSERDFYYAAYSRLMDKGTQGYSSAPCERI